MDRTPADRSALSLAKGAGAAGLFAGVAFMASLALLERAGRSV